MGSITKGTGVAKGTSGFRCEALYDCCFTVLPCVLAGEYDGAEVTRASFSQLVYLLDDVLHKDAVGHDCLSVAGTVVGLFSLISLSIHFSTVGFFYILTWGEIPRFVRLIPTDLYGLEGLRLVRYVNVLFILLVQLCHLHGLCPLYVKDYQRHIVEQQCNEKKEYYLSVLHGVFRLLLVMLFYILKAVGIGVQA